MRYRLDDLGWFHFEKLIQSLLKADLGLAIQSWGGHSDLGRDAYTRVRLRFPDRKISSDGPFVFQAKFVQGANASGAKWGPALEKAIAKESEQIGKRRSTKSWREPKHYVLLTNCPLTATIRNSIEGKLRQELPKTEVTSLGGTDICDILDKHPELRRSFPEILSLRDLDILLSEAVSKHILERSRAAVEESRDLIPVFVPTQAYHKAWRSIKKYSFVVLDGPPEMGKTAIARVLAFSHLLSDWQAVDCRNPEDFFSIFSDDRQQIFIADDAFGRTEYDPVLGRMWERDLPRIFHRLDSRHRLVWTTRKHILMRARRDMDLTGKASRFPNPGEVIVTANDLSVEEKARILYRHSKSGRLELSARELIKNSAVKIVGNEHFTPERIRRFVIDVLPELDKKLRSGSLAPEVINAEVSEAIRNPTDRMRKSFRKLHNNHKWVLVSFLDCAGLVERKSLLASFNLHQPNVSEQAFEEILDDLLGTFLKFGWGNRSWLRDYLDWIHPSYRDLVIDELSSDRGLQSAFLERSSTNGIKLALSQAGGVAGERQMPLMNSPESWSTLAQRCEEIADDQGDNAVAELLDILSEAIDSGGPHGSNIRTKIERILRTVCEHATDHWKNRDIPLDLGILESYYRAYDRLDPPPTQPNVISSWRRYSDDVRSDIDNGYVTDPSVVKEWSTLTDLIETRYPSVSDMAEFRDNHVEIEQRLFELAEEEVHNGVSLQDPETNESEGRRVEDLADVLSGLDRDGSKERLISGLVHIAEKYREHGPHEEEENDERHGEKIAEKDFNVEGLFEDL